MLNHAICLFFCISFIKNAKNDFFGRNLATYIYILKEGILLFFQLKVDYFI